VAKHVKEIGSCHDRMKHCSPFVHTQQALLPLAEALHQNIERNFLECESGVLKCFSCIFMVQL
jgi:hypothetical protein